MNTQSDVKVFNWNERLQQITNFKKLTNTANMTPPPKKKRERHNNFC